MRPDMASAAKSALLGARFGADVAVAATLVKSEAVAHVQPSSTLDVDAMALAGEVSRQNELER